MIRILIATIGLSFAATSSAMDFSTADALFQQRAEGLEKVMEARAAYGELAAQATGDDKLYAIGQMSRLDYVRGEILLPKSAATERKAIFKACMDNVNAISPQAFGSETEAYYTWKITCFTYWAEVATIIERGRNLGKLKKVIKGALPLTTNDSGDYVGTLEGGAIGRYIAAIYGNPGARAVGLYDIEKAKKLITEAWDANASEDRAFPEALSGADYFENVFVLSTILNEDGQTDESISELEDAIELIEELIVDDELPGGREYESKHQLERLKAKLAELS